MAGLSAEEALAALTPKTQAEAEELIELGIVLKHGMNEVDKRNQLSGFGKGVDGKVFENAYRTHFPMPDGREWEVMVKRRQP